MWIDVDQRKEPEDWLIHRTGCVTASRLCDVMAKLAPIGTKDSKKPNPKEAAARRNYRREKRREWLTGRAAEHYVSPWMDRGTQNEDLAINAYEIETGESVLYGGIYVHEGIPKFMASPDGRVGEDGLVEAKYLTGSTTEACHEDLIGGDAEVPEDYVLQMQGQLACSGRKWVDFVSYDGSMPENLQLFVKRFPRDEKIIAAIEFETIHFLEEVISMLKKLGASATFPAIESSEDVLDQAAQLSRVP